MPCAGALTRDWDDIAVARPWQCRAHSARAAAGCSLARRAERGNYLSALGLGWAHGVRAGGLSHVLGDWRKESSLHQNKAGMLSDPAQDNDHSLRRCARLEVAIIQPSRFCAALVSVSPSHITEPLYCGRCGPARLAMASAPLCCKPDRNVDHVYNAWPSLNTAIFS